MKKAEQHGRKAIVKLLTENAYSRDLFSVFSDFVELSAIAISNSVDLHHRDAREERYLEIAKRYDRGAMDRFAHALAECAMLLQERFQDLLGSLFMELDLGNKWNGQFFTPYELSLMMAMMQMQDAKERIAESGFITVMDPCVGGGAMVIAVAQAVADQGIDYQRNLHVTCIDVDSRAAHMAYIQLSLLGVPAVVRVGNSLSMQMREVWYTPAHIMGGWTQKLASRRGQVPEPVQEAETMYEQEPQQLTLFERQRVYAAMEAA